MRASARVLQACSDERQGDDSHGLLRIVRAVRERDERGGRDLGVAEAAAAVLAPIVTLRDPVRDLRGDERDEAGGQGGGERRDDDLGEEDPAVDRGKASADDCGSNQATEEGVRRARGQAVEPGEQVPDDRADQAGKDLLRRNEYAALTFADDSARDGAGHLRREERADKIQDRSQQNSRLRLQRARRDRRRHSVRRIVEAVRKNEKES